MYKSISMPEFYQQTKREDLAIIDVREEMEYQMGHVPRAKNFPLSDIEEQSKQLEQSKAYYIICHSGSRSSMACQFLATKGFDVTNVMGGTSAWMGSLV